MLQPLPSRLLALDEARALQGLRRMVGEHSEENALGLAECADAREDERDAADGAPVHDERQARIRDLAERLELGPALFGDGVPFPEVRPRLEEEPLAPQNRVAHRQPRLERDSRVARLQALLEADGAHERRVRGRIVDGPHDCREGPRSSRRLIDDDPRHFFGRQRPAQAGRQLEELPPIRITPARVAAFVPVDDRHGSGASRVRTYGGRKA